MYDAQQGSTSGAHIDMSTASGTNNVHGMAYVHRGTDWFNAAPYFYKQDRNIPATKMSLNCIATPPAARSAAPLIKDKLFVFASYQHTHASDLEIGTSRTAVPSGLTDDRSPAASPMWSERIGAPPESGGRPERAGRNRHSQLIPSRYALLTAKLPTASICSRQRIRISRPA